MPPHFDEEGVSRRFLGGRLRKPLRVGDEWWVSDFHADCIHRLDERLRPRSPVSGRDLRGPRGMCRFGKEVLVCCYHGETGWVTRISSTRCRKWVECERPRGIACDEEYAYVTEVQAGAVARFHMQRDARRTWLGKGMFRQPRGIACAGGTLVVADSGNDRIVGMTARGQFLWEVRACAPNDVATLGGRILASEWYARRVVQVQPTAAVWASPDAHHFTMLGADDDRVLVADDGGTLHVVAYDAFQPTRDANASCLSLVTPSRDVVIDLSGQRIDDTSLQRLLPDLARATETTNLQLWQNELACRGVVDLMHTVRAHCRLLATVWLGHNAIGDAGARAMATSFGALPNLRSVFLDDNRITCAGAQSIASHIPDATRLKRLGLHTNLIRDRGATRVVRAAQEAQHFEFLWLHNNYLSSAAREAFATVSFVKA